MKKIIKIDGINEVGGRVLLAAPGVVENTPVAIFLNDEPTAWGKGKIVNGVALIIGKTPLPATYSLRVQAYTLKTKLIPAE